MSWRADLITRLTGDAPLAAVFGQRIAFFEAARSWTDYPRLVLQEISPGREYTHSGADGLDRPRVQFDIFSLNEAALFDGETALIIAMERQQVVGGTRFHFGFLEARSMPDPGDLANQRRVLRLSLDFTFFHEAI